MRIYVSELLYVKEQGVRSMYTKIQELLTNTFEIMKCYSVSTGPAIETKMKT